MRSSGPRRLREARRRTIRFGKTTCGISFAFAVLFVATAVHAAADVALTRDGQTLTASAKIAPGIHRVADAGNDGAVLIQGEGLTIDFQGAELVGCTDDQQPDQYVGKGLVLTGRDITLRNAKVRGYKAGIFAHDCLGLTIEDVDISGNYQKHLLSTPETEDGSDWLFGHDNEKDEWMENYGAGLYVKNAEGATIRRVRARHGQNGILLVNVNKSKVYDNDCSFLSGWGLGIWRCCDNVISRNAFDFCVRGYSHGVYNRGQDSAGIFCFEQNCRNIIAENSATHGGDCFFGFAGREAIGDSPAPTPDFDYRRRGCNDNLLINNDFSYAPAHGIEMTFSFGNKFVGNRLVENAICGVWGGFCQDTLILGNDFEGNGQMGYGLERGGVNIENGRNNIITGNTFKNNKAGVHFWGPPNKEFLARPWAQANHPMSADNVIAGNSFEGDQLALHLRGENRNILFVDNKLTNVTKDTDISSGSELKRVGQFKAPPTPKYEAIGQTRPVGARKHLRGRQNIIMTEWGPYDFTDVLVYPAHATGGEKTGFQVLGPAGRYQVVDVRGDVKVEPMAGDLPGRLVVTAPGPGLHPFTLTIEVGGKPLTARGTLVWADWDVKFYAWTADPRAKADEWKRLIAGKPIDARRLSSIDFKWGGGTIGPDLPGDHFGTVATTRLDLPAGAYRLRTVSDDGIRVWVDGKLVIDDWTWHPPKPNDADVRLAAGKHELRIEHFEIDGVAQLEFRIEPAKP